PRLPENLHTRVDLARVDQALDADVVLRVGGVIGIARHVAVHAAFEIAPMSGRAGVEQNLLGCRSEFENIQRVVWCGDDAVGADCHFRTPATRRNFAQAPDRSWPTSWRLHPQTSP